MSNETAQGLRPRAPASQGTAAEFERLYRANVDAVTAFFARRSADPQTVADLTADTFVAAIASFTAFDPGRGTARAWVFGTARRVYAGRCEAYAQQRGRVLRLAGRRELDTDQVEELIGSTPSGPGGGWSPSSPRCRNRTAR